MLAKLPVFSARDEKTGSEIQKTPVFCKVPPVSPTGFFQHAEVIMLLCVMCFHQQHIVMYFALGHSTSTSKRVLLTLLLQLLPK